MHGLEYHSTFDIALPDKFAQISRSTMKELVEFMGEVVREGLTKEEIKSQVDFLLDEPLGEGWRRTSEIRKRNAKRFRDSQA